MCQRGLAAAAVVIHPSANHLVPGLYEYESACLWLEPRHQIPHPYVLPLVHALQAHLTRTTDRELLYLSAYLSKIARLESLADLNHK